MRKQKQINTWRQYQRFLSREGLLWHMNSNRFVRCDTQGTASGESHYRAKKVMHGTRGARAIFGPAMRRWLSSPPTDYPPGYQHCKRKWLELKNL